MVALEAAGPIGPWLVEQLPDLGGGRTGTSAAAVPRAPAGLPELPELPISPELAPLLDASGAESGRVLGAALEAGALGQSHRAVLVNLLARVRADALAELAEVLEAVDPASPGYGLATVLADLAVTRRRMLDELTP
jgi:hypothetical protein